QDRDLDHDRSPMNMHPTWRARSTVFVCFTERTSGMNDHIHKMSITDQLREASCGCSGVGQNKRFNGPNTRIDDTLERAIQQLDSIEQLITMLMDDIDLNELKTSEKLNFALKLMAQHARTLKL